MKPKKPVCPEGGGHRKTKTKRTAKRKPKTDFGRGCAYCLGLFLAHEGSIPEYKRFRGSRDAQLWFNAASDHLYGMKFPKGATPGLNERLRNFRDEVLDLGHGRGLMRERPVTWKDVSWAVGEAQKLLLKIDSELLKVATDEGRWK